MAKVAIEHLFQGTTQNYSVGYDSTKTLLGQWIQQKTGALSTDKFAGPFQISIARPMEQSTAIACAFPHVIDLGNGTHWIFLAETSSAAVTRRIVAYTFNTTTQTWGWLGFITLTYPTATNHTIRGMRVARHLYTTGTVEVSGTTVTGTTTAWQTALFANGARIGFGSTDPTAITTWYTISTIDSDTGITLTGSAGTIAAGTSFVIDELRVYTATTNATAANGGLFVVKGISIDDFAPAGTIIGAATTVDNVKAVYWLADASIVLNTASGGIGLGTTVTNTNHDIYVINADAGSSLRIYKYNGRASLTGLAAGKSTSAFVLRTGAQAVTGTISQTNSCRLGTLNHGPGSGVESIYGVTTTRIYRVAVSGITSLSTTFVTDAMVEIPPGSVNTFAATGAMTSVEIMDSIDRLLISTGASQRHYVTQYNTSSMAMDRVWSSDNKQLDHSIGDAGLTHWPNNTTSGFSFWSENGITYLIRNGTTSITNIIYAVPLSCDWDFAAGASSSTQQRLITPSLSTTGCTLFSRVSVLCDSNLGSDVLGTSPEPYRIYYRVIGISDNSGAWNLVGDDGNLTSITSSDYIQFMIEFKMIGSTCIPAKIYGIIVTYDDNTTDSHYQPSVAQSNITNKRFAWRFSTAFGTTVPTLTIRLYDAVSGTLLLTDTTATQLSGTFEKSTNDGVAYGTYDTTDKANDTTYIRYTPTTLGDNIKVRAILTQG